MTTEPKQISWDQFVLPVSLVSKSDLSRLIRELESLSNTLTTDKAKQQVGFAVETKYMISDQMKDFVEINGSNLSEPFSRDNLLQQLRILKDRAPTVHITLAARVENSDLADLLQWFRREIHRQTVLIIGLQPDLIGGAYIRTPNHIYDYSIRSQLDGHSDIIAGALEALSGRS